MGCWKWRARQRKAEHHSRRTGPDSSEVAAIVAAATAKLGSIDTETLILTLHLTAIGRSFRSLFGNTVGLYSARIF
jgi:hypothetical protein